VYSCGACVCVCVCVCAHVSPGRAERKHVRDDAEDARVARRRRALVKHHRGETSSAEARSHPLRKTRLFLRAFPVVAPSLSWQNDQFLVSMKWHHRKRDVLRCVSHHHAPHQYRAATVLVNDEERTDHV
jgi:hypothetical protein